MKTHIQVEVATKELLEKIRDEKELASISAVVKLLIKKCGGKIS